jgi:hypothetical protein
MSINSFYYLFCSDDDNHTQDIPSDNRTCFFPCVSISAEKEGNHACHEDDKHSTQDDVDCDFDEREENFIIE